MITRRDFCKSSALISAAPTMLSSATPAPQSDTGVTVHPYQWEGPYAEHRAWNRALHDWRLCAEVKTGWLGPCERLILRTSEVIGHETGFLYDDHFPPSEPEGRGKNYRHIPFEWQVVEPGKELFTDCAVPGVGGFSMRLKTHEDVVDIDLTIRNQMPQPMQNADWSFCAVSFESPSISDSEDVRTCLFDGERLRTLAEIAGRDMHLYKVAGAHGFIPVGHRAIALGPVEAKASLVIIPAWDKTHCVALGFEQADHIYGDTKGNKCFHADPYFGPEIPAGGERSVRGKLYLIQGSAEDALHRYQQDFGRRHS